MKTFNKKKGFTIVELVIVIAVIGVLTAILVPTFVNLINKANNASDESLVKNLNTQLRMKEQTEGKNKNLSEALEDAKEIGYLVENLKPKGDRDILWNQESDEFVFVDQTAGDLYKYWKMYDKAEDVPSTQTYSIYARGTAWSGELSYTVGFDAGQNTGISKLSYVRPEGPRHNVVIRTSSKTTNLAINAPFDHVARFGDAGAVEPLITADNSFEDRGSSAWVSLKGGRYVITEDTDVKKVYLDVDKNDSTQNLLISLPDGVDMPELIRPKLDLGEEEVLKIVEVTYGSSEETEIYYLQGNSTIEDGKVLVSTDGGETKTVVTAEDASDTAKAIANAKDEGGDVVETGLTPEEKETEKASVVEEAIIEDIEQDTDFVARIGTTGYETLKAAVQSASANDTIEMTASDNSTETISVDKVLTIKMNGKTFGGTIAVATTGIDAVTIVGEANVDAVMKYGDRYFNSFVTANNGTVTLLKDFTREYWEVNPGRIFTVDLNGHTLTLTAGRFDGALTVYSDYDGGVGGTLNLLNGTVKLTGSGSSNYGVVVMGTLNCNNVVFDSRESGLGHTINVQNTRSTVPAQLTLEGGSVLSKNNAIYEYGYKAMNYSTWKSTAYPQTMSLNGTYIESESGKAIEICGSNASINNCSILANNGDAIGIQGMAGVDPVAVAEVVIMGNTSIVAHGSSNAGINARAGSTFALSGNVSVTADDGSYAVVAGSSAVGGNGSVSISGGTYTGGLSRQSSGTLTISGGKFSVDPSQFVDSSAYAVELVDGYYVVSPK